MELTNDEFLGGSLYSQHLAQLVLGWGSWMKTEWLSSFFLRCQYPPTSWNTHWHSLHCTSEDHSVWGCVASISNSSWLKWENTREKKTGSWAEASEEPREVWLTTVPLSSLRAFSLVLSPLGGRDHDLALKARCLSNRHAMCVLRVCTCTHTSACDVCSSQVGLQASRVPTRQPHSTVFVSSS